VADASGACGGVRAACGGEAGGVPRGGAGEGGAAVLRALAANECSEPRGPVSRRSSGHGARGDDAAGVQEPVPTGVAEPGWAVAVVGRADESHRGGVCEEGTDRFVADPDCVH